MSVLLLNANNDYLLLDGTNELDINGTGGAGVNLTASPTLGAAMAAAITLEIDIVASMSLGVTGTDLLTEINGFILNPLLGADMAVTLSPERDLVDNNAVGVDMAAAITQSAEIDIVASMSLGFNDTDSLSLGLSFVDAIGISTSVTLSFERLLSPSFSLGLTQTHGFPPLVTLPSQDIQIKWLRRDRLAGSPRFVQDNVPMSEAVEKYDVEIILAGSVVRTFSNVLTNTVTYTAAQQIADGWTYPPIQLMVRVFQLSAVVGRGFGEIIAVDVA